MTNPWLEIPLDDYEGHMALPEVGQAQLLADLFADALTDFAPSSVAVVGCSGGNGFDYIPPACRVVGIDLNPAYLERVRERYDGRFDALDLHAGDIQSASFSFAPVDLAYAALLFEYVDPAIAMERMRRMLAPAGALATVIQLADADRPPVTRTPYASLARLARVMRLLTPAQLRAAASAAGLTETESRCVIAPGGKPFQAQVFRVMA